MNSQRRFFLLISILSAGALVFAAGGGEQAPRPQGMSLRMELFVDDLEKSVEFYTKVLGFERLKGSAGYAPVRCGSVLIGLGRASELSSRHYFNPELRTARRGLGTEIVLEVDDLQAFYEKVKATGYAKILSPPHRQTWGATDFRMADPDGYYLRITSR